MNHPDLPYMIALSKISNIGPITAKLLIGYCGSAEAVFSQSKAALTKIPQIGPQIAKLLKRTDPASLFEPELAFIERVSIRAITYLDHEYPNRLKQVQESPIILYVKGDCNLNHRRTLSVIGTRKPTEYGLLQCERILTELKEYDIHVISGLAFGIDACAHRTSLQNGIPTLGVLGHSFETIYPAHHRSLAKRMIDEDGALITEFPSGTGFDKENFPMRNRIVAGMCDGLLIVESGAKGGSMITAQFAHSYHKELFAVPGRLDDPLSEGCLNLLRMNKAYLVRSGMDIAEWLNWEIHPSQSQQQKSLFEPLDDREMEICDILKQHPKLHIDSLAQYLSMDMPDLSASLLQLEFKGILKSLPGKRYILI